MDVVGVRLKRERERERERERKREREARTLGRSEQGWGRVAGRVTHNGRAALIRPDHSHRTNVFYCPEA